MNIPCPDCQPCELVNQPYTNLSSEGPDHIRYITTIWPNPTPRQPRQTWEKLWCEGMCVSDISQEDADLCALRNSTLCQKFCEEPQCPPPPPKCATPPCPPEDGEIICNKPQTCSAICPDGTIFTYTISACEVYSDSQKEADSIAFQLACQFAIRNRVCINPLNSCLCVGVAYSATLTETTNRVVTWSKVGNLPPGLTFHGGTGATAKIDGTPTTAGTYQFDVVAKSSLGTATKAFSFVVLKVATTSIPDYTIGVPYSFQLQATGGSGNYAWKIDSGSLPDGLTMSESGLISGTPT